MQPLEPLNTPRFDTTEIVLGVCHSLALITTTLRLLYRVMTHRLWWDDFWAFVALLGDLFVVLVFLIIPIQVVLSKPIGFQIFWKLGTLVGYTFTLYAAKLSIALSIVRLVPEGRFRRLCKFAATWFLFFFVGLVIQKVFSCGTRWKDLPTCGAPRLAAYLELTTDLLGDLWLIGAPVYMLWKMKLPSHLCRLFMVIFGCGIFITFASIAHAYFIIVQMISYIGLTGHIQIAVSIWVCNLLVLGTWMYRVVNGTTDEDNVAAAGDASSNDNETQRSSAPAFNTIHLMRTRRRTSVTNPTTLEPRTGHRHSTASQDTGLYSTFHERNHSRSPPTQAHSDDTNSRLSFISQHPSFSTSSFSTYNSFLDDQKRNTLEFGDSIPSIHDIDPKEPPGIP